MQKQWTISQLDCDTQWKVGCIRQLAMNSSMAGQRRSSKALPKAKLVPQNRSWSLFGGLLPVQSTVTFWIPAKPLHLRSMLSKSISCTKTCSACNQHWSRKGPIVHNNAWLHVAQPVLQKLNGLGYEVLPHPPYSPDLVPTNYHFFKHPDNLLQGKCFRNQQEAENAFQEFIESRNMNCYATGMNKLIPHRQKYVDCNGSILINKEVWLIKMFKPSYNDLEFMIQNRNYFFPKLISCRMIPTTLCDIKSFVYRTHTYVCTHRYIFSCIFVILIDRDLYNICINKSFISERENKTENERVMV